MTLTSKYFFSSILFSLCLIIGEAYAQKPAAVAVNDKAETSTRGTATNAELTEAESDEKADGDQKYRLLQSNDLFVETAYLQEEDELEHSFSVRVDGHKWSTVFSEEIPLGSDKHQLSISFPTQFARKGSDGHSGVGDMEIEYNYGLFGGNASRVTISPGVGITLPTGNSRRGLGSGATGISAILPIGIMLTPRIGSNSSFEATYTRSAKNDQGEKANLMEYEFGQSLVWYARPRLNFLIEGVWEISREITGPRMKNTEHELFISPGVRWAHSFRNGLMISPGIAFPIGVGPSRGENGIFFYIAFEHSFKKETE